MSITAGSSIYTGAWINWSRGAVLGATVTLTQRNGSLFTAFLGIFVTIAGGACWRILSFLVHQHRAGHDKKDKDALHHQQQVILRNSGSSTGTAWQMIRFAWNKRKLEKKQILRNLPFVILALCNTLLFAVAGVFSSAATKAADSHTLISSSHCGYLLYDTKPGPSFAAQLTKMANDTFAAVTYSRACYDDASNELQCGRFPRSQLALTSETNVSCPFQSHICLEGPSAAFQVKSGWIDTNSDLGVNSKPSDRLQYRKVTTCSVLHTAGYFDLINTTDSFGDPLSLISYYYGPIDTDNFTFSYNLGNRRISNGYILSGLLYAPGNSNTSWIPIPELIRTDADVTLMFLAQGVTPYATPVLDPWFMATTPFSPEINAFANQTFYIEDSPIRVLGCADQFQLCNQAHTKCTPLTGSLSLSDAITAMQLNDIQKDISLLLFSSVIFQSTYYNVNFRGLRASDTLSVENVFQVGLPNNQWTIEITGWFVISMAKLQQQVIDFATGPLYTNNNLEFVPGPRNACGRQKIRNRAGYISFSMLSIVIILSIGGALIFISLILDSLVGYFRKTFNWKDYKRLQWARDEQLELQRLAYATDVQEDQSSEGGNALVEATSLDTSGSILETDSDTNTTVPAQMNTLAKQSPNRFRFSFNTV